jgi:hypothetical protein
MSERLATIDSTSDPRIRGLEGMAQQQFVQAEVSFNINYDPHLKVFEAIKRMPQEVSAYSHLFLGVKRVEIIQPDVNNEFKGGEVKLKVNGEFSGADLVRFASIHIIPYKGIEKVQVLPKLR